jgi:hypothetical protein
MPDTGAPWNIPYVEPADLVRDYPAADEAQALAIAAGLTSANSVIRQVLQTVKTNTFSTTSNTFVDVTDVEVTITPTSNTNKVLVICTGVATLDNTGSTRRSIQLRLAGGNAGTYVGNAAGSRTSSFGQSLSVDTFLGREDAFTFNAVYLDSPATTSAVTYKLQALVSGSTGFIGRTGRDQDIDTSGRMPASITVIEVEA